MKISREGDGHKKITKSSCYRISLMDSYLIMTVPQFAQFDNIDTGCERRGLRGPMVYQGPRPEHAETPHPINGLC